MRNPVAVTVFSVTTSAPTVTATDRQEMNFQDRSAIISSPPSSSERSGEGEGGDEMR